MAPEIPGFPLGKSPMIISRIPHDISLEISPKSHPEISTGIPSKIPQGILKEIPPR